MKNTPLAKLRKDEANPRKPDPARLGLLRLSIAKLGFVMPMYATKDGMLLSGHQRYTVATELGIKKVPIITIDLPEKDIQGVNILFNRATNDFSAFDTGSKGKDRLNLEDVISAAEELADFEGEDWLALGCEELPIKGYGLDDADKYDKKACVFSFNSCISERGC